MKIKTNELTSAALDWAVAKCENFYTDGFSIIRVWNKKVTKIIPGDYETNEVYTSYSPSADWAQGGPIIELEKLELRPGLYHSELWSCWGQTQHGERLSQQGKTGPTPLIAAMRCYVASKLGDEVEVPDELA